MFFTKRRYIDDINSLRCVDGSDFDCDFTDYIYKDHLLKDIKTGDVFATHARNPVSKLIRFVSRSEVSHVGLFVWLEDQLYIVESLEGKGLRMMPFYNRFTQESIAWWARVNHNYSEEEIKDRILTERFKGTLPRIGDKYDLTGAALANWFNIMNNSSYCSEYVEKILNLNSGLSRRGTVPDDIMRLATKYVRILF